MPNNWATVKDIVMTTIGVTGHQHLPEAARIHVEQAITKLLCDQQGPVIGLSSLADGADQIFADVLLRGGGTLHAVIPCWGYASTFDVAGRENYLRLLNAARSVTTLAYAKPSEQAYDAAGQYIVEHCDVLVAVWDGQPAVGRGGTADAVAHARRLGRDVAVTWPDGVLRG
jgi:hypothetical protein